MPSVGTVLELKSYADILLAGVLTASPQLVHDSPLMRAVHGSIGLKISNGAVPEAAGFNQAIACMIAAIAVAQIVSARVGPPSPLVFLSLYVSWGVLFLAVCALTDLGCSTVFVTAISNLAFAGYLWHINAQSFNKGRKVQ